ncbi:zinc metallopeptidase [Reinekea thalattae]|uniref:Zinc metallopeptidase n=1 Tax=Reinekea thalattae TaxID=2593301 RepID=A0A5C8ZAT1_9GAMM|nr:zinc metallopeptidase [Reinekea thalattae]TXR54291.1 zinc metallopeptidase [Reinekea thalattae]
MIIILIVIFLIALLGPSLWVKHVLAKHSNERDDLDGTGGELAEHLIKRFQLDDVKLELTKAGDHYDPSTKTIRLSEAVMNKKSITAVATATHEFGHALQHARQYGSLLLRYQLAIFADVAQRFANIAVIALPIVIAIPGLGILARLLILLLVGTMLLSTIIHLVTLPVEFDASFGRALPILKDGNYVSEQDLSTVNRVLLACALTYVAQAMFGLLNFSRWFRLLRR